MQRGSQVARDDAMSNTEGSSGSYGVAWDVLRLGNISKYVAKIALQVEILGS